MIFEKKKGKKRYVITYMCVIWDYEDVAMGVTTKPVLNRSLR